MENSINSSPAISHPGAKKGGWLFVALTLLTFLLPLAIVPYGVMYQAADKTIIFACFAIVGLLMFIVARLIDGVFNIPRSRLLLAAVVLMLAYLVSSIFSVSRYGSFSGTLFDSETFWLIFLLMAVVYLASVTFRSLGRVAAVLSSIFASGTILLVVQILHVFLGWNFGILGGDKFSNLLGTWYNFGIFFGLLFVICLAFLEFAPTLKFWRKVSIVFAPISIVVVYFVGLPSIWHSIIGISALITILKMRIKGSSHDRIPIYALISIVLSLVALIYAKPGTRIANKASEIVTPPIEVRPDWSTTFSVGKNTISSSPVIGIGPNMFSRAWVRYKPLSVNTTPYWSTDFVHGAGYITSSLVTVGIIGFLAWIAFIVSLLGLITSKSRGASSEGSHSPFFFPLSLGALYIWIIALLYIPDSTILFFGAILAGVSIAIASIDGSIELYVFSTRLFAKRRNLSILLCVIALLGALSLLYLYVQKYRALAFYKEADTKIASDIPGSIKALSKATSIDQSDIYYRAMAQANLSMLANAVEKGGSKKKDDVSSQQQYISLYNDALDAANKALATDGSQYLNWILLGNVYESVIPLGVENTYERAKEAYNKAAVLNPTSPFVAFEPARLEAAHNNPKGAIPHLNRSLELKPNYAKAYSFAASLALSTGDLSAAIAAGERAVAAAPDDFSVYFQLGYLVYVSKDYNRAVTLLEQSVKLNPQYANAKYFLGLSYDKVDRRKDAIKMFSDILSTNPENGEVAAILANLRAGRSALGE